MQLRSVLTLVIGLTLILSLVLTPATFARRAGSRPKAKTNKTSKRSAKTNAAPVATRVPASSSLVVQDAQLVPYSAQAVDFAVSPPLSEMGIDTKEVDSMRRNKDYSKEPPEKNTSPPLSGDTDSPEALAASVQSSAPTLNIPAPASPPFEGLSNADNANHPAVATRVLRNHGDKP